MRSTSVGADIAGVGDGTGKEYMYETATEKVTGRCEKMLNTFTGEVTVVFNIGNRHNG